MKTSTKIITAAALGLGVVGGVAAYSSADHRFSGHHGWHSGDGIVEYVRDELSLTPEQTASLEQLRDQLLELRTEVRQDRETRKQRLLALVANPTFDQAGALALVSEKTAAVDQYAPQVIASLATFYDGLDANQQAQVRDKITEKMSRHWHH